MSERYQRRGFLEKLGVGAAGLLIAGQGTSAQAFSANETLNIGCIGTGGRCRQLMEALAKIPGTRITAVCDIWDDSLQKGRALADSKAAASKDYHELLDRSDVDAVVIGAPDHWHVPMTIDACEAGKDVYCEKPLTHNLEEGQSVVDAQNKNKKIVQVGTQQRSMPQFLKAYEIVKSGVLGEIFKVHLTWNRNAQRAPKRDYGVDPNALNWKKFLGNAPDQPFDEYRYRNWRWFWDFGGGIFTDLMVHFIDVAHWYLGVDHPEVATSIGSFFTNEGMWETPDTVQTLLRYPGKNTQVYFEGTFANARNGAMLEFMGSNATLYLDRGRYEILPERKKKVDLSKDEMQLIFGKESRGADFYDEVPGEVLHLTNWIECVKSRKKPHAPAEAGVSAASAAHLANRALRSGQVAKWG